MLTEFKTLLLQAFLITRYLGTLNKVVFAMIYFMNCEV